MEARLGGARAGQGGCAVALSCAHCVPLCFTHYLQTQKKSGRRSLLCFSPPLVKFLFGVIVFQDVDFLRQAELCGDTHTQSESEHTVQGQEVFRKVVEM